MKRTFEEVSNENEEIYTKTKRGRPLKDRSELPEWKIALMDEQRKATAQSRLRKKTEKTLKVESVAKTENHTLAKFEEDDSFDQTVISNLEELDTNNLDASISGLISVPTLTIFADTAKLISSDAFFVLNAEDSEKQNPCPGKIPINDTPDLFNIISISIYNYL